METNIEKNQGAEDYMRIMFDMTPLCANLWDKDLNVIDCNQEAIKVFKVKNKQEYLDNFYKFTPEIQPDGRRSKETAMQFVKQAFEEGSCRFESMRQTIDGEPIPMEVTMVRVEYRGEPFIAAYSRDLREEKKMLRELQAANEHARELTERTQVMLDSSPLCTTILNNKFEIIDCNEAAVKMFNMSDKQEYLKRFYELMPEYQPDGSLSRETAVRHITKAFYEGYNRMEWVHQTSDGELVPSEVTLVRVNYKGEDHIVAYTRDLREHKKIMSEIEQRDNLLNTVNRVAAVLLTVESDENTKTDILESMKIIGNAVDADRVQIWKNEKIGGEMYFVHTYGWLSELSKQKGALVAPAAKLPYSVKPAWARMFLNGEIINAPYSKMPPEDQEFLKIYDMKSVVIIPLFLQEKLWGLLSVGDCVNERTFTEDEMNILRSTSLMMASALHRTDIINETRAAAAKLNAVISNYAGVIWSVNTEGIITLYNGMYLEKIGVTPDFIEGKSIELARQKNRHLDIIEMVNKTIDEEQPQDWISDIDGLKFHARTMPMYDENGGVSGVVGSIDEVTEMIELQEKLKEQNISMQELSKRTQLIIDTNPHITILFNSSFKVIDCNPAAMEFMGFDTKEELIAGFTERLVRSIPETQSGGRRSIPITERFMTVMKEGSVEFETDLFLNGVMRNAHVEFKKIPYGESFAIVGYVFDMTDIHKRELELIRIREENELRLVRLNLATKATKIAVWDVMINDPEDPESPENIYTWSDEMRWMLGFTDETDFPNTIEAWFDRLHPDDARRADECFIKHVLDKTGRTPYDAEYRMLKKNGEYAYFRDCGETIRDENGNALRIVGAIMDINDTKNMIIETERHRVEAESANKAKSAFLSTMSHEIRTPMNAILGITEIQLQNESLDQSAREAFDKIYISGDMLLAIINDILDLSKIESGKLELIVGKYEIASLISDTAQLNMMRIGSKPIEFELEIDENSPTYLSGDELRVKQILNNILSNAFKYTASGTVTLAIKTEPAENNDDVILVFSVADTGQGMTKEQVAKLFDEYSRFNEEANRTTEGTGLGMSITRNLIRMMHGEILIESEPGVGSKFTVRVPQGRVNSEVLGKEMVENLHQFRTSSRAHMKRVQIAREPMPYGNVLIVDDVETNIYVARGLMAPYGLNIDSAESGFAAIEKIKTGSVYDIVFMDHMMPKMDGIEATRILRELGYDRPIVALTANAVAGQADIFLGNGFDDFISKPIDVRQLNVVLNKLIRDKQPPEVIEAARKQAEVKKDQAAASDNAPQQKPAISQRFAEVFARDASKSIVALEAINGKQGQYNESDIRTYIIHVHGMKSALGNIGKMELSAVAMKLETLARDGDVKAIASETTAFIDSLKALVEELVPTPKTEAKPESSGTDGGAAGDTAGEDSEDCREKLLAVKAACEEYDENTAENIIAELKQKPLSQPAKELLGAIADHLLHSDFDEIVEAINKFTEK